MFNFLFYINNGLATPYGGLMAGAVVMGGRGVNAAVGTCGFPSGNC